MILDFIAQSIKFDKDDEYNVPDGAWRKERQKWDKGNKPAKDKYFDSFNLNKNDPILLLPILCSGLVYIFLYKDLKRSVYVMAYLLKSCGYLLNFFISNINKSIDLIMISPLELLQEPSTLVLGFLICVSILLMVYVYDKFNLRQKVIDVWYMYPDCPGILFLAIFFIFALRVPTCSILYSLNIPIIFMCIVRFFFFLLQVSIFYPLMNKKLSFSEVILIIFIIYITGYHSGFIIESLSSFFGPLWVFNSILLEEIAKEGTKSRIIHTPSFPVYPEDFTIDCKRYRWRDISGEDYKNRFNTVLKMIDLDMWTESDRLRRVLEHAKKKGYLIQIGGKEYKVLKTNVSTLLDYKYSIQNQVKDLCDKNKAFHDVYTSISKKSWINEADYKKIKCNFNLYVIIEDETKWVLYNILLLKADECNFTWLKPEDKSKAYDPKFNPREITLDHILQSNSKTFAYTMGNFVAKQIGHCRLHTNIASDYDNLLDDNLLVKWDKIKIDRDQFFLKDLIGDER